MPKQEYFVKNVSIFSHPIDLGIGEIKISSFCICQLLHIDSSHGSPSSELVLPLHNKEMVTKINEAYENGDTITLSIE